MLPHGNHKGKIISRFTKHIGVESMSPKLINQLKGIKPSAAFLQLLRMPGPSLTKEVVAVWRKGSWEGCKIMGGARG